MTLMSKGLPPLLPLKHYYMGQDDITRSVGPCPRQSLGGGSGNRRTSTIEKSKPLRHDSTIRVLTSQCCDSQALCLFLCSTSLDTLVADEICSPTATVSNDRVSKRVIWQPPLARLASQHLVRLRISLPLYG